MGKQPIYSANVTPEILSDGNWHHVAYVNEYDSYYYTYSGTFYLDGNELSTSKNESMHTFLSDQNNELSWSLHAFPIRFGGCNVEADEYSRFSNDRTFINQMDEIKIWTLNLDEWQIRNTMNNYQLQDPFLVGYWNFDDKNCRLNFFDDLSYQNNMGMFREGATLVSGDPAHADKDSLYLISSNTFTDSVRFSFVDQSNRIVDSVTVVSPGGKAFLYYNLSSLPYGINLLRTHEYYPGERDTGFIREFPLRNIPAVPTATPRNGWSTYFERSWTDPPNIADSGCLYNAITVSGLPENTQKVSLELTDGWTTIDTMTFYRNSNPYHHSLSLDGKTNYIVTSTPTLSSRDFTLMFWFKTTSKEGGVLAQFSSDATLGTSDTTNFCLGMKKNGSLSLRIHGFYGLSVLHATGQYNDGAWHHFAVVVSSDPISSGLYIDGTVVDRGIVLHPDVFSGYWMFGRSTGFISQMKDDTVSAYLQGSYSEISLWNHALDYKGINQVMYLPSLDTCPQVSHYYKLDEGKGTLAKDSKGNLNGTLMGGPRKWFVDQGLNTVTWVGELTRLGGQEQTLKVKAWTPGNDTGYTYELGRFNSLSPSTGDYLFTYNFEDGLGYFNLGDDLTTTIDVKFNDPSSTYNDYIFILEFYEPDGTLLKWWSDTAFNSSTLITSFTLDLGDVPMGSFLYMSVLDINEINLLTCVNYPILIKPFAAPKVSGHFGPFIQAIAPGTMQAINTFTINTAEIPTLTGITAKFVDSKGFQIAEQEASGSHENWQITYDMASLSPPITGMFLEYYLGSNPEPVLEQGPFDITITRTRPYWFDFCKASDFSDIEEDTIERKVTFTISSPLEDPSSFLNDVSIFLPEDVPLLNGAHGTLYSPGMEVKLKFWIDSLKLAHPIVDAKLNQYVLHVGAGKSKILRADFQDNLYEFYRLDTNDNLWATQNFDISGGVAFEPKGLGEMGEKILGIIKLLKDVMSADEIISPTFSITLSGAYKYSSRLHLKLDTINGKTQWGSYGDLMFNANEGTPENDSSASYHFYAGSFGVDFEIGAKLLEGLAEGDFCLDLKFNAGFGHSYITIPKNDTKFLKDFNMDIHGKMVVKELWGLTSQTVWGPKLFYSHRFWGDDMEECFPDDKAAPPENSLAGEITPVSTFVKTPMAYPQASITPSANYNLFTWLEKGDSIGERHLRSRFLKNQTKKFSDKLTIHSNTHAINNPISAGFSDSTVLIAWSQSRYDGLGLTRLRDADPLRVFAESQDIWFAVFDITTDSIIQMEQIYDDLTGMTTGRAEAKPALAILSESLALLTWQVADLENHASELWYATLTKTGEEWTPGLPAQIASINGIETDICLGKTSENKAVLTCLNNRSTDSTSNRILSLTFEDMVWSTPAVVCHDPNMDINYFTMNFKGQYGSIVYTAYVSDTAGSDHEVASMIPWDPVNECWGNTFPLAMDSVQHYQYPEIALQEDGKMTVAVKLERFMIKTSDQRISQVDLLTGNLNTPSGPWYHLTANPFVCDTTKQVSELSISYIGQDTLMVLTQEYVMLPANTLYYPVHGSTWGNPYMNQVLRCVTIPHDSTLVIVPMEEYLIGTEEPSPEDHGEILIQNYPNPCTDHTTIRIELPEKTAIVLELFDMQGHLIGTLANQTLQEGAYTIAVNTSLLQSGTYLYKLTTEHAVCTRRMVVIR
ncbi:MAG: T9SS type A sorting domain-containing protein, partial [Bacteroidales bacterium]|nr:T9SS type A sorting domain-containing protein [Bacteroidales bacterium]